jgi:maltose-binding protein MalE
MEKGRAMPVAPQMRQIWDGMRGPYQLIMNGAVTPEEGARRMQRDAEKRIADTFL